MNRLFKNLYSKWLNHISATEEGDQQSDNLMELLNTVQLILWDMALQIS